jgi:hypothetical protein
VNLDGAGAKTENSWHVWVYPTATETPAPDGVVVSRAWDAPTRAALEAGKKVLFLPSRGMMANALPGSFTPPFWSPIWFHGGALTMSILCDPKHPALARFPTGEFSDWQWYDLLQTSGTMVLEDLPPGLTPIVRVVDNFARNQRLGNLIEARVGAGRLLVCSMDLTKDLEHRPAAAQMLRSLLAYAAAPAFDPVHVVAPSALSKMFWEKAPLEDMRKEPGDLERATLHVKASVNVPEVRKSAVWERSADQVLASADGFGYSVHGGTWRDEVGSAWHDGKDLAVEITCPKGFAGALYVHLWDWNSQHRVAEIAFQGRKLGVLEAYDGPGVWLAIPVTAEDSADGRISFSARPLVANAHITEIALVPAR